MKVGSLVEIVRVAPSGINETATKEAINNAGYKYPEFNVVYTIRGFTDPSCDAIYLEEIVNPEINTRYGLCEVGFGIRKFLELQPPMDLSEIQEYQHPKHLIIH